MAVIDSVAKELHMKPDELLKESLKAYLELRLSKIEAGCYLIAKKHGVKDVFEMDKKAQTGGITERDSYDDYFILDNLEAERDSIKKALEEL